ncbi:MAG: MarR family transcriptional regulator [Clostridia bacterium]|nr:MarR family transcriptional regulator [Clostridia bacterium]
MMENYDALKLENQLCFPLYAASREVIKRYAPFLGELDLTYTQYIVMMVLWQEKEISVKELGGRLFLDSGTLTPVLKSLDEKGFVSRRRSAEDERVVLVAATKAGAELRERAASVPGRVSGCVRLEPRDAAKLYELLYKLLGAMDDGR